MEKIKSLSQKIGKFVGSLGACLIFVYVLLPYLTESVGILSSMSQYLETSGIDPTRYYYTDVAQVKESENYLDTVLGNR